MKKLVPLALGAFFAAAVTTSAFAQCSHSYKAADLSNLKIAADEKKPEEAMSTYDPVKLDALLGDKKRD